jgi:hypothetical protein
MPNWVYNRVHGSKKAVEMLVGPDGNVTFEKLIPTPPAMSALSNYEYEDSGELTALIDLVYNKDDSKLKDIAAYPKNASLTYDEVKDQLLKRYPLSQLDLCKQLLDEYGIFYWYHWRCKYWGCKWDARNDFGPYDGTEEEIEFQTPWSPPEGVMQELARRFPDLELVWHCDEESCEFSIDYIFNGDGTISEEDVFPEFYTPYIPDEDYLRDAGIEYMTHLSDVKECIKDNLGEASYNIDKETLPGGKCNITLTVYDWECYGGEKMYDVTYSNLEDDE